MFTSFFPMSPVPPITTIFMMNLLACYGIAKPVLCTACGLCLGTVPKIESKILFAWLPKWFLSDHAARTVSPQNLASWQAAGESCKTRAGDRNDGRAQSA
jgi:hypothetical protein